MILILGDSNYRNTMEVYGESLSRAVDDLVNFEFFSSVESLRLLLTSREVNPSIIVAGSPLNEIASRITKNTKKGKDETVRTVIEELVKTMVVSANDNPECLHLIMPPFTRQEPRWMEDKVNLALFYTKEGVRKANVANLAVGSMININPDDLVDDRIHLNDMGKEKLHGILESDINKCKLSSHNMDEGNNFSQDWASQMNNEQEPPTPLSIRKRRMDPESEDSDSEQEPRKKAKTDQAVMNKLEMILAKLGEHKDETKSNFLRMEQKLEGNKTELTTTTKRVDKIEKRMDKDDLLTAEMREDIDGLENENLKSVVIVRKLATTEAVPTDKKGLSIFIQRIARDIVREIVGEEAVTGVKYVTTLYSFIDPTKKDNQKGLVPPFKIGFRTKDAGVNFRESAVKKAKEGGSRFSSTYFTHCQSSATRIRVMLLWGITDSIKSDTREVWVNQNANKPTLQIKESGKVKTLTFAKAMIDYKDKISKKTLEEATKVAKRYFTGQIKKTFIVISD